MENESTTGASNQTYHKLIKTSRLHLTQNDTKYITNHLIRPLRLTLSALQNSISICFVDNNRKIICSRNQRSHSFELVIIIILLLNYTLLTSYIIHLFLIKHLSKYIIYLMHDITWKDTWKICKISQDLLGICDPKPKTHDPKPGVCNPKSGLFDPNIRIPRVTMAGFLLKGIRRIWRVRVIFAYK